MTKRLEAMSSLRSMSAEDLDDHLRRQRRRLFEVRFQQATGQVENHSQIAEIRREIARTMTIQAEIRHGIHVAPEGTAVAAPKRRARGAEAEEEAPKPKRGRAATAVAEPEVETEAEAAAETETVEEAPEAQADAEETTAEAGGEDVEE